VKEQMLKQAKLCRTSVFAQINRAEMPRQPALH